MSGVQVAATSAVWSPPPNLGGAPYSGPEVRLPAPSHTRAFGRGFRRLGRTVPPADLQGVEVIGGLLCALTPAGALPLYRFSALQGALLTGESVGFATSWPEHLKPFVYAYVPLPALAGLGRQTRDSHGLRPWDQGTYRGWPLYLYADDRPGLPAAGTVPFMFEPVVENLAPLPQVRPGSHGP